MNEEIFPHSLPRVHNSFFLLIGNDSLREKNPTVILLNYHLTRTRTIMRKKHTTFYSYVEINNSLVTPLVSHLIL